MSIFQLFKMPSPKNTNYEGFYIAKQTPLGPELALDEKLKAKDADPGAVARGISAMLLGLKEQLGTEAFRALCSKVCDGEEAEDEGEETFESPKLREMDDKPAKDRRKAKDARRAKDEPADFPGKPETEGNGRRQR